MSSSNLSTYLARVSDSMILVATMDTGSDADEWKKAAKKILKTITPASSSKCTIEAGAFYYHYMIESGVCYLTLAEKGYPRALAYTYLEEVCGAFQQRHGAEVARYSRPYAAVSFDPQISKIRRSYLDPSAPGNMRRLNNDLAEIHNIMTSNITEILQRGEKLDVMESRSMNLLSESKKFHKLGKWINIQAMYKTYGPVVAILFVVTFIIYLRFFR